MEFTVNRIPGLPKGNFGMLVFGVSGKVAVGYILLLYFSNFEQNKQ
jgi:hypothetical protein